MENEAPQRDPIDLLMKAITWQREKLNQDVSELMLDETGTPMRNYRNAFNVHSDEVHHAPGKDQTPLDMVTEAGQYLAKVAKALIDREVGSPVPDQQVWDKVEEKTQLLLLVNFMNVAKYARQAAENSDVESVLENCSRLDDLYSWGLRLSTAASNEYGLAHILALKLWDEEWAVMQAQNAMRSATRNGLELEATHGVLVELVKIEGYDTPAVFLRLKEAFAYLSEGERMS